MEDYRPIQSICEEFSRGYAGELALGSCIELALARRATARHGGTLTVSDAEGGACFTRMLPGRGTTER